MIKESFQRHFSFNVLGKSSFLNVTKSRREYDVCNLCSGLLAAVLCISEELQAHFLQNCSFLCDRIYQLLVKNYLLPPSPSSSSQIIIRV